VPGHEKEFFKYWKATANFLKHADQDADDIHEMDDEVADLFIVITSRWYRDLGNSLSPEMIIFANWWALQHPNMFKPATVAASGDTVGFYAQATEMSKLPRQARIKIGQDSLRQAKKPKIPA